MNVKHNNTTEDKIVKNSIVLIDTDKDSCLCKVIVDDSDKDIDLYYLVTITESENKKCYEIPIYKTTEKLEVGKHYLTSDNISIKIEAVLDVNMASLNKKIKGAKYDINTRNNI